MRTRRLLTMVLAPSALAAASQRLGDNGRLAKSRIRRHITLASRARTVREKALVTTMPSRISTTKRRLDILFFLILFTTIPAAPAIISMTAAHGDFTLPPLRYTIAPPQLSPRNKAIADAQTAPFLRLSTRLDGTIDERRCPPSAILCLMMDILISVPLYRPRMVAMPGLRYNASGR